MAPLGPIAAQARACIDPGHPQPSPQRRQRWWLDRHDGLDQVLYRALGRLQRQAGKSMIQSSRAVGSTLVADPDTGTLRRPRPYQATG